jgi:DNA-binding transcriptional LysR family regulator
MQSINGTADIHPPGPGRRSLTPRSRYRQFVAVAEEMNSRRAAERLHMAQPPLTAAIRRIESELGVSLIERTNRVERLTPAGEVFLLEARRVLAQSERAVEQARRAGQGLAGALRVTFVATAAHELLPAIVRAFRARHGDVSLELQEATTAQQAAALRDDRADIGLVALPVPEWASLTAIGLRRTALVAVLPQEHRLASSARLGLADLVGEAWILFPPALGPGLHRRIVAACSRAGFAPNVVQQAVQMDTIASLVAAGLGVSVAPPALAEAGRPGVRFRPLHGRGTPIRYELGIAYARRSPLVDAFVRTALDLEIGADRGLDGAEAVARQQRR